MPFLINTLNPHLLYSCSTHRLATALQAARLCPSKHALALGPSSTDRGTDLDTVVEGKVACRQTGARTD